MFEVFQLTFGKVCMLLIFIGIGYFLRWHHDLPDDAGRVLSLLCTLVFLPAYFITNMSKNVTMDALGENTLLVGYGALFVVCAVGLSFLLSKPFARSRIERNSLIYAFAFPNYGYFGYPVIEGVFGSAVLADAMVWLGLIISLAAVACPVAAMRMKAQPFWRGVMLVLPFILLAAQLILSAVAEKLC